MHKIAAGLLGAQHLTGHVLAPSRRGRPTRGRKEYDFFGGGACLKRDTVVIYCLVVSIAT